MTRTEKTTLARHIGYSATVTVSPYYEHTFYADVAQCYVCGALVMEGWDAIVDFLCNTCYEADQLKV